MKKINDVSPGLYELLYAISIENLKDLKTAITPLIRQIAKHDELTKLGLLPTVDLKSEYEFDSESESESESDFKSKVAESDKVAKPQVVKPASESESESESESDKGVKPAAESDFPEWYAAKATEVIESLKYLYPNSSDATILNISFRLGDKLHAQWSNTEEKEIIPILVNLRRKPVGQYVANGQYVSPEGVKLKVDYTPGSTLADYYDITDIMAQYDKEGLQDEAKEIYDYTMQIDDMLRDLIDGDLPLSIVGLLYGYPIESTIALIKRTNKMKAAEAKTKTDRLAANRALRQAEKVTTVKQMRSNHRRLII
jgi:hypothetical protein